MQQANRYLNTDLDLRSRVDLSELVLELDAAGVTALSPPVRDGEFWCVSCECSEQHATPELSIRSMLEVVERLSDRSRALWSQCVARDFNIGYECDDSHGSVRDVLPPELLRRLAIVEAAVVITVYAAASYPET